MAKFNILIPLVDKKGKVVSKEHVEIFEEKPAPAQTLGGRLIALQAETGFEHIAEPEIKLPGDDGITRKLIAR